MAISVRPVEGQTFTLLAADDVSGLGRHPLFRQGTYRQGYTLLITGDTVEVVLEPVDARLREVDVAFVGGCEFTLDAATAAKIFDAGLGRWLTLAGA